MRVKIKVMIAGVKNMNKIKKIKWKGFEKCRDRYKNIDTTIADGILYYHLEEVVLFISL